MRYAIYYAPAPGSLLHSLGSAWLGRDVFTGVDVKRPYEAIGSETIADAARYGFHATLKPPFHLRHGTTRDGLIAATEHLASSVDPVALGHLQLSRIDGFMALTPRRESRALDGLAEACVRELDGFRAPPAEAELQRRRSVGLTPRQEAHLQRWGYPYVLDEFRLHMTLTRRLSDEEAVLLKDMAAEHFGPALEDPCGIDALTIFHQSGPHDPFLALARFPLLGRAARVAS